MASTDTGVSVTSFAPVGPSYPVVGSTGATPLRLTLPS